jgi:ATP-dependent helicase/nuclease subunit A
VGLGARWRNPAAREDKDDLYMHGLREEWKRREAEESNRLLYVAMTRAEEHLVLSWSGKPANWSKLAISAFQPAIAGLQTRTAPDGREWKLRVSLPDAPPEGRPELLTVPDPGLERERAVVFLDAPHVTGQQNGNATVTALAKFAKCPREYYLGTYLGFRSPAAIKSAATDLGTQVHALLAELPVPDPDPEALQLAEVFRQSPIARRLQQATRIEREFDFLMSVEDLVIRGQIDLWFEAQGELCIVDYKTDSVTDSEAHQRAQDYALQLRLYGMAIERVAGRMPDRAYLHFLRPNTLVEVDLRPSLLDVPEQIVRDFQEAQNTLRFPLVEAPHCRRCAFYKSLCPAR